MWLPPSGGRKGRRKPALLFGVCAPCEVQSPSTAALDRGKKLRIYAQTGVSFAWMLDPAAKMLEVLRLERGHWAILATSSGTDIVRAEPFDVTAIELAAMWE